MAKIVKTEIYGLARRAGIKKGEELTEIDGRPFSDILDYVYAEGQDECVLTIKGQNGERKVKIKKRDISDTIGLEFDASVDLEPKTCHNKCVFCFIDQLPKGMRDTLYVKDDDYRLSFSSGCYVTCTNLSEKDIERIIDYKLSPLYVSVHATDHETRLKLLGIKRSADQMELLERLTKAGIKINAQIVLVPGVNDGKILQKSLTDLQSLGENVLSVAVVPVGLTKHRQGLPLLRKLTREEAAAAIDLVEEFYDKYPFFAYCSDEMYEQAGREVKPYDYYGAFDQIENGVGLVAKFLYEVETALQSAPSKLNKKIAVITGVSGEATMKKAAGMMSQKWRKVKTDVFPVKNNFFGAEVTVSGLVTAGDIIERLKGEDLSVYDEVMIPSVMLKEFETVFLDNITLSELEEKLNRKITVTAVDGDCLVDTVVYGA